MNKHWRARQKMSQESVEPLLAPLSSMPLGPLGNNYPRRARMMKRGGGRLRRVPEEAQICQFIPNGPPTALYDIGVGTHAEFLTLKEIYPELLVFGCEPHIEEYRYLLPFFGGPLANVAISDSPGKAILYRSPFSIGGSTLFGGRGHSDEHEVDVITLDQFDAWAGRQEKILLWMDIEDSELAALRSGADLLRSGRVEWLNVETRNVPGYSGSPSTADITTLLEPYGYVPVHRHNVQGSYPEAPGDTFYFKVGVKPLIDGNTEGILFYRAT